jgi:hypothetical protein
MSDAKYDDYKGMAAWADYQNKYVSQAAAELEKSKALAAYKSYQQQILNQQLQTQNNQLVTSYIDLTQQIQRLPGSMQSLLQLVMNTVGTSPYLSSPDLVDVYLTNYSAMPLGEPSGLFIDGGTVPSDIPVNTSLLLKIRMRAVTRETIDNVSSVADILDYKVHATTDVGTLLVLTLIVSQKKKPTPPPAPKNRFTSIGETL